MNNVVDKEVWKLEFGVSRRATFKGTATILANHEWRAKKLLFIGDIRSSGRSK